MDRASVHGDGDFLYGIYSELGVDMTRVTVDQPCPQHTSPGCKSEDMCSHLTYTDGHCDLWRAGVDGLANLINQSCDILKILLLNL